MILNRLRLPYTNRDSRWGPGEHPRTQHKGPEQPDHAVTLPPFPGKFSMTVTHVPTACIKQTLVEFDLTARGELGSLGFLLRNYLASIIA